MSALSRRQVFLSGAAVVGAATLPTAAAGHPDAELLAVCAEYGGAGGSRTKLFDAYSANGLDVPEELLEPLDARLDAAEDAIISMEAQTLAGVVARAHALVASSPDAIEPYAFSSGRDEDIARATIRDLLAVMGVSS
jgi:hypothetical protein